MLTGNALLIILISMMVLMASAFSAIIYLLYKKIDESKNVKPKKSPNPIVEVDRVKEDQSEGWGFLVDGQIVLRNNQPFIFAKKKTAQEYLEAKYPKTGKLIYQRWDIDKQQLLIGEVVQRGTD